MSDNTVVLPSDFYNTRTNKLRAYFELDERARLAIAKRIDLTYQIYLATAVEGDSSWLPKMVEAFENDAGRAPHRNTLGDDLKIFQVLRFPAPHGLGITLAQAGTYSYGRMRVLAQNAEWTLANADRAREMLEAKDTSEPKMRQEISEAINGPKAPPAPQMKLIFDGTGLRRVDSALKAAAREIKRGGGEEVENPNDLLLFIIDDWKRLKAQNRNSV